MPYHLADVSPNTHDFVESAWQRAPKEIGCALSASLVASPLVSIVDKAMVKEIAGIEPLLRSVKEASKDLVKHPKQFFGGLPFRLTAIVYFGTFAAVNISELVLDVSNVLDTEQRKQAKAPCASTTNVVLLLWRDSIFARKFGGVKANSNSKAPLRTLGLFAVRDSATMWSTFYIAPKVAQYLVTEHSFNRHFAEISTALVIPVMSQFITAPLHIHAMDYYARPQATIQERIKRITSEYRTIALARGLRILPAFGIGSYCNNKFRELFIRQPNEELLLSRKVTALARKATTIF